MTRNKDLGTITIASEEDYRARLIEVEKEIEDSTGKDTADYIDRHLVTALVETARDYIKKPDDTITASVMEDLKSRADRGFKKYNTTLELNNHQNMLQHGYEEALDLAQYLKKEITTLNTVQDLVNQYSNDTELGAKIRELYAQK